MLLARHPCSAEELILVLDEEWERCFARLRRRAREGAERLRRSIRFASTLLVDWCLLAGVPFDAVAYAVLPASVERWPGDYVDRISGNRVKDWNVRGAPPPAHSSGSPWGVTLTDEAGRLLLSTDVRDGILQVYGFIGGLHFLSHGDSALIIIEGAMPHAIAAGAAGRRVRDVVDHPLLVNEAFVVSSVEHCPIFETTQIRFSCPLIACATPRRPRARMALHVTSGLAGSSAVDELLDRAIDLYGLQGLDAPTLRRLVCRRAAEINLGCTCATDLAMPTRDMAQAAIDRARARRRAIRSSSLLRGPLGRFRPHDGAQVRSIRSRK